MENGTSAPLQNRAQRGPINPKSHGVGNAAVRAVTASALDSARRSQRGKGVSNQWFLAGVVATLLLVSAGGNAASPEERLAQALQFPTVSHQNADHDVTAFKALHRFLEQQFPSAHQSLERELVADLSLLYTWKGSDPSLAPILLTSHLDVVPAPEATLAAWEHPPFDGVIADGFVWGRGAMDDKVGVLATMEAVEGLLAAGFQPRRTVMLAFGHDEELGGPEGAGAITDLLEERGVRFWFSLDEGMVILEGGAMGLSAPIALIGIAEKGSVSVRITARAAGGHSSMPPPEGAIGRLSKAVIALEANPMPTFPGGVFETMIDALSPHFSWGQRFLVNTWPFSRMAINRLSEDPSVNAILRTTTAITMAGAGTKTNILPRSAWVVANFRIVPGDSSGAVVERVREIIDDETLEIEVISASEPSPSSDPASDSYAVLAETIAAFEPAAIVTPALVVGGTDTKHYGRIAENAYRFTPMRITSDDRTRMHGINERISVANYLEIVGFYEQLVEKAAGAP